MRLCMFSPGNARLERGWPGRIEGDRVVQLAAQTLQSYFTGGGKAREHAEFALDDVDLRPPVLHPPSVRNFEGLEFRFSNPASIYGPDEEIPYPEETDGVLYGLQIAAVIGANGAIGGFTIMNDWRARDLTPAKDTDFATSIGPVVVTLDELGDAMVVRVNGEEAERRSLGESAQSWDEIVGRAAQNTRLLPGDLIGVGKAGSKRRLEPGDVIELEVQGIGVLRNAVRSSRA
jgi:2-keto-4-pentenoate hydratase/2-oxohepta-3-ene-1,7-dioic acid hydratase in catechol pathway